MSQETTDKQKNETDKRRLTTLVLPILGVCWVAFLAFPGYIGEGTTVDYTGMALGVGLMVAGAFRFLYAPSEESEKSEENGANRTNAESTANE